MCCPCALSQESNGPYNPYTSNGRELKRGPRVSHEGNKAVFVDSLSGRVERPAPGDDGEDDDMDIYGYKSCVPQARKNRPGQRARRAKYVSGQGGLGVCGSGTTGADDACEVGGLILSVGLSV